MFGDRADIWFADYDEKCVAGERASGRLDGFGVVTGDQADEATLKRWVSQTKGRFHIVIDDGGHTAQQQQNSFDHLFQHALQPGGLYFIEDMQCRGAPWSYHGYRFDKDPSDKGLAMADVIKSWIDQLLVPDRTDEAEATSTLRNRFPIPKGIHWIFCQYEACVIAKCIEGVTYCSGQETRERF